jgi:hypothetical protein
MLDLKKFYLGKFGGAWVGKDWYILLCPFRIYYGILVYLVELICSGNLAYIFGIY